MKTESNNMPEALSIERCAGDIAEVIFCENIEMIEREEVTSYTYDEYRTAVPYRENLLSSVKSSYAEWLAKAKEDEAIINERKPSLEETVSELVTENAKLREQNDIIGTALEETIALVMEGTSNG